MPIKLQQLLDWIKPKQSKLPSQNLPNQSLPSNLTIPSEINLLDVSAAPIDQVYIESTKPYLFYLCLIMNGLLLISLIANSIYEYNIQKSIQNMEKTVGYLQTRAALEKKIQILADKITLYKSYASQEKDFADTLQKFLSQVPADMQVDAYSLNESGITFKAHSETPLTFASFISNVVSKKYVSSVSIKSALLNNVTNNFDVELEAK